MIPMYRLGKYGLKGPGKIRVWLGLVAILLLVLTACNASSEQQAAADGPAVADESQELPLDFELTAYQGQDILGAETVQFSELLEKDKPIVLNFWAGLCPPCRVEMPDFQAAYEQHQDEILFVGLDVGTFTGLGTKEEGQALVEELDVTYPTGTTSNGDVMQAYKVLGMPSTAFITPEGELIQTWTGLLNEEKLGELIDNLIEASAERSG